MNMLLGALDIGTQTTSLVAGEFDGETLTVVARTETETNGVKVWSQPGVLKIEADEAQAQVYTASGSLVWEGRVINQLDLDLNQGIYIVKVHNASSTQSKKVIVK